MVSIDWIAKGWFPVRSRKGYKSTTQRDTDSIEKIEFYRLFLFMNLDLLNVHRRILSKCVQLDGRRGTTMHREEETHQKRGDPKFK